MTAGDLLLEQALTGCLDKGRFLDAVLTDALALDDDFLVDGLEPKNADYVLMMARRNPSIRPTLAAATRMRRGGTPRRRPTEPTTVYFLRRGISGPVKIGCTSNIPARVAQLQTAAAEPLHVIGTMPGGRGEEADLHRRFAHLRLHGEWFRPAPELIAYAKGSSR